MFGDEQTTYDKVFMCRSSILVESLVDVLVSAQQEEPPEHVSLVLYSSPPPEEPPQQVLPHPQAEAQAPLQDLLAPPQTEESLVTVLTFPPPEELRRLCLLALRRRHRWKTCLLVLS